MVTGSIITSSFLSSNNVTPVKAETTTFELFHDQGYEYISNIEPSVNESVTLRLRADKGVVSKAVIQYTADGSAWKSVTMKLGNTDDTGYYEYWVGNVPPSSNRYYYRFYAEGSQGKYYCGPMGMSKTAPLTENCFLLIPGLSTPDWAKGIVWYSILPDAFFNGDVINDTTDSSSYKTIPWGNSVQGLNEYYGGDISGIEKKIDYIKSVGADAVYINPLWTSNSNAGYGPNNDFETSPNYGNEEELVKLTKALHDNGLKVMLDAVFSYAQMNSIYTNRNSHQPLKGAFQSQSSQYSDMFNFISWPDSYTQKWGGIEIDMGTKLAQKLFWQDENSVLKRYLKAPYNIDGWRLDAVSSYAGTDTTITELAADIRKNVKETNPDSLLIAEDFMLDQIMSGNWDATWNNFFLHSERLWFKGGEYDQSWLKDRLDIISKIPRSIGLCMYNHYDSHDITRLATDTDAERHLLRGVHLMLMTYIGSPCIYYGDETGLENNSNISKSQPRNSFNWNENEWDNETVYLYRALSDLRKEYTALKDGVFKLGLTDDANRITVYGRWDDNGTVVTMLNQQEYAQTVKLNLKQYNIPDGTVVTDYLTGQTYKVSGGFADVVIPSGGSILVTGTAGNYRESFKIENSEKLEMLQTSASRFTLNSIAGIDGVYDDAVALSPLSGCGYVEADIPSSSSGVALILRDSNAKQYTAVVENGKVSVYGTDKEFVGSATMPASGKIRVGVTSDSKAAVFVSVDDKYIKYSALTGTVLDFEVSGRLYAGVSSVSGEAALSGLTVGSTSTSLYDSFDSEILGALLREHSNISEYSVNGGKLTVRSGDATALMLSESRSSDYTFKAAVGDVASGFAGVVAYCDMDSAVALVKKSNSIIFGYLKNGELIPQKTVSTDLSGEAVLQLQRVGSVYTAVYVNNGVTTALDTVINANMSVTKAGIVCNGTAQFNYVSFGNSIDDTTSFNTPVTNTENVGMDVEGVTAASKLEVYEIIGDESEWEYAVGGIKRTASNGLSQLAVTNKTYSDFKVQCTLLPQGTGSAGITMLRSSIDATLSDGYILELSANSILTFRHSDKVLYSSSVSYDEQYGLKLTVMRSVDKIYIYVGQDNKLVYTAENISVEKGYIAFYLNNASGVIGNYRIASNASSWLEPLSPYAQNFVEEDRGIRVKTADLALANIKGVALTAAKVSVGIELTPSDNTADSYAGLLFAAAQNTEPKNGGILISLNSKGIIAVSEKGEIKCSAALGENVTSVHVTVVAIGGCYKLYLDGMDEPSLVWNSSNKNGGTVSLVSYNSLGLFRQLSIEDISNVGAEYVAPDYIISRNDTVIEPKIAYSETRTTGDISFFIEPFLDKQEQYSMELDFVVRNPASAECSPIIYFRGSAVKKIGLYLNGNGTYLVNENKKTISDVNAESTYRAFRRSASTTYHISIASSASFVTVKINNTVIYDNFNISNCLSGDFSGLPARPEILCVQGSAGTTVTTVRNIEISGTKTEWQRVKAVEWGVDEPAFMAETDTIYSNDMSVSRLGTAIDKANSYTETIVGKNITYNFGTELSDTADYVFSAELCTESRTVSWICPQLVICSGTINGVYRRISVTVRGDGIFILNEKTGKFGDAANYSIKAEVGQKCRITVLRCRDTLSVWCDGQLVFDSIPMGDYAVLPNTPGLLYIMNNSSSSEVSTCTVSDVLIWNRGLLHERNLLSGDLNGDGIIDICDMVLAKCNMVSLNILGENGEAVADISPDGILNDNDIEAIRNKVLD